MTSNPDFEEEPSRRNYQAPYSHNHPIPTVQRFREHQNELIDQRKQAEDAQHTEEDDSKTKRAFGAVKTIFKDEDNNKKRPQGDPYPTANQHTEQVDRKPVGKDSSLPMAPGGDGDEGQGKEDGQNGGNKDSAKKDGQDGQQGQSATEKAAGEIDPKQKRKNMKHNKRDDGGRVVTDPVTHLPLVIRDATEKDLRRALPNEPKAGTTSRTATGLSGASKSSSQLEEEREELQKDYDGMQKVFPPPAYDDVRAELERTYQFAFTVGLAVVVSLATLVVLILLKTDSLSHRGTEASNLWWRCSREEQPRTSRRIFMPLAITIALASGVGYALIAGIRGWLGKRVENIWEEEMWDAARSEEKRINETEGHLPESTAWMNGLLASVWPLINPDLFASIVDMLEDVMQASLPKIIRMVSVDDLGQGSEAIRILGIRSLPTGAASQPVDEKGNLKPSGNKEANDRAAPGECEEEANEKKIKQEVESDDSRKKQQEKEATEDEQKAIREGMEAEQGDFVNMELAFAYRARSSGKSLSSKAKNAHLYLKFYLPGGIFVPVWVELRGMIGTIRLRLQLTPDPPFFSLCTLTFLGQPRADLSCVPLSKHLPNLMDVPLISSFVQSSIDAALAEYVAPKSLTLDLKDMLVGHDFKKDTTARGVLVIFIKEAKDFKEGDAGIGPLKGSSDAYVTCSWGKFGKTVSSTRIIEKDQHPKWHEWAYMLVTPEELNAEEKLRLQLWDSDKFTADDDLGRVEVDLKDLMHSPKSKNQMCDREDRFRAQDADEEMPGTLTWSVGYYDKTGITNEQLSTQPVGGNINTKEALKQKVSEQAESKLREATARDESKEITQQEAQDYKERENALICASPPDSNYPSGVLSIQIHNITGLEIEQLQKRDKEAGDGDPEDESEQADHLPSAYCTLILNHMKVYRTRTKPKNSKPFFNAGTERFVRDWKNTEVMVSVRDSREGENDALLGIVYLPLRKIFANRSQAMEMYPLVGGIGFGRIRISMLFRGVEMKLPKELLGWDYGTLEIKGPIKAKELPENLQKDRLKLQSDLARGKMAAANGEWMPKHGKQPVFLACRKRYAMPLVIAFRKSSLGPDPTPAFAIFWLKDIADEEEKTVTLPVWKGSKERLQRARMNSDYNGLEEGEKPLGEIEVDMVFWSGLSGYHKSYANKGKNSDVRDVMEVLDTVNDEIKGKGDDDESWDDESDDSEDSSDESRPHTAGDGKHNPSNGAPKEKPRKMLAYTNQDNSDSDSDSDDDNKIKNPLKKVKDKAKNVVDGHDNSGDGSRGLRAQIKDYKDHKELHRKHRGIMQWKAVRKAGWAVDKMRHGKERVSGVFEHSQKSTGIETEV